MEEDGTLAITFSETIDDFVYNLKQTMIIDDSVTDVIKGLVERIEASDEETARGIIRAFEENTARFINGIK